ncbi:MAG: dephospho-CoA kinase [candidate division Zixibacteria bacterium]|nr:dephospho-CoA kinase [candidate division Zixibacteria bacterium]
MGTVIGVVGGIASGKSTVARVFESLGAFVIDADGIGHSMLDSPPIRDALTARFGFSIQRTDGTIDRRVLGGIVFGDEKARHTLNHIVRPAIRAEIRRRIAEKRKSGFDGTILVDAALLIETGPTDLADTVVLVTAPAPVRKMRLIQRNRLSDAEAEQRIAAQVPDERQRRWADHVLENTETIETLEQNARRLYGQIVQRKTP